MATENKLFCQMQALFLPSMKVIVAKGSKKYIKNNKIIIKKKHSHNRNLHRTMLFISEISFSVSWKALNLKLSDERILFMTRFQMLERVSLRTLMLNRAVIDSV